jgi:hypothetical protein
MKSILRTQFLKKATVPLRSGWDRPDVPLLTFYTYRRQIGQFESQGWWYDGIQPEFLVNYADQHLHDHWGTLRHWEDHWIPLLLGIGAIHVFLSVFFPQWEASTYDEHEDLTHPMIQYHKERINNNQLFNKPSFLGTEGTNADTGVWRHTGPGVLPSGIYEPEYLEGIRTKRLINVEGKNWITRVEEEVRQKYKNYKPGDHGHEAAHHHH